jgi:hypothetical protein
LPIRTWSRWRSTRAASMRSPLTNVAALAAEILDAVFLAARRRSARGVARRTGLPGAGPRPPVRVRRQATRTTRRSSDNEKRTRDSSWARTRSSGASHSVRSNTVRSAPSPLGPFSSSANQQRRVVPAHPERNWPLPGSRPPSRDRRAGRFPRAAFRLASAPHGGPLPRDHHQWLGKMRTRVEAQPQLTSGRCIGLKAGQGRREIARHGGGRRIGPWRRVATPGQGAFPGSDSRAFAPVPVPQITGTYCVSAGAPRPYPDRPAPPTRNIGASPNGEVVLRRAKPAPRPRRRREAHEPCSLGPSSRARSSCGARVWPSGPRLARSTFSRRYSLRRPIRR